MFGISFAEFSIIILLIIIIVPPQDLPKIVRFFVKLYKQVQDMYVKILRELNILDIDK
tara:strand:- start:1069 stop:1242 length:174 start_codon:yes stop_codon:yes gene_type:complete